MNVSDYIRAFWEEDAKKPFSPNETRLYFFLLDMMVRQSSCKQFECSMRYLETCLLLPKMTITRSRDKLSQRGLIQVIKGDRKVKNPIYFLCGVTNNVTKVLPIALPKCDQNVTNQKEETSPTPPKEENNIYNNKETSSNEEVKKETKKKKRDSVKDLPDCEVIDEAKNERMDWKAFETFYNNTVASKLPQINGVTDKRRKLVKAVIKTYGKDSIAKVMNFVINSPWHTGINNRGWTADIDWIFNPNNYVRLLDKARNYGASTNQNCGGNHINSGAVQDQPINIYKEVFGYDGAPENFEEWFNKHPYGS